MARRRASIERAAALHRRVAAAVEVAQQALDGYAPEGTPVHQYAEQHELAARLRAAATELVPDWLGAPLDAFPSTSPLPAPGAGTELPRYVRLGLAQPLDDARFPVVAPLLGAGHLAIDADARDERAAGLLGSLVLRLVAATPAGALRIRPVDATGSLFRPFHALTSAGLMTPPASDSAGLRSVLVEAEEWVREPGRHTLLLVIASLPELTDGTDLARIAALAGAGPAKRLHLVIAGWPPPPLTAETTQPPLAYTTQVALRNPYVIVSDPPGGTFGATKALNSPVYLDPCPPVESIRQVCAQVAAQAAANSSTLTELLPRQLWREGSAEGLAVTVGRARETPLTLQLSDLTPHWLVGGSDDGSRSAFLTNVLYGLSTRYSPEELALYLLDFREEKDDEDVIGLFAPTPSDRSWIPHVRVAASRPDREYGVAVLRELHAETTERAAAYERAGVTHFSELRKQAQNADSQYNKSPRVICVIDEFDTLVRGADRTAKEALATLDSLARKGRSCGIHLILATATLRDLESLQARRDATLGQFPVRIALAGGADVLDPLNQAANGLAAGLAVINTAGGLGGPIGVSRAHERVVEFPDPLAEPGVLAAVRHRLWEERPADSPPPHVFDGRGTQRLPESLPATVPPTAYLGRVIDVPLSLAGFPLGPDPGRHLAVLGPSELAADILDAAARSLAGQHAPGSVDFVLASFAAARGSVARLLDQSLRALGHRSRMVDAVGLKEVVADPALNRTYVIGFGLDGTPSGGLGALFVDGPARGVHVIGWWRGLRRFREESGGTRIGLVILNLPAADAAQLIDDAPPDWQPRPNRALLHDPHTGRTALIQPFVHSGQTR